MNVYEIQQEFRALDSLLNEINEETGEFINCEKDIEDYINNLESSRDVKLDNIEKLKREIAGSINTIDDEIKRLQQLKKTRSNNIDRLKSLQFALTSGEKIETELYKFSTRKSVSVEIIDPDAIEDKYCTFKKVPNKTEIKAAIAEAKKNGESFFGADLVEKVSIAVK